MFSFAVDKEKIYDYIRREELVEYCKRTYLWNNQYTISKIDESINNFILKEQTKTKKKVILTTELLLKLNQQIYKDLQKIPYQYNGYLGY